MRPTFTSLILASVATVSWAACGATDSELAMAADGASSLAADSSMDSDDVSLDYHDVAHGDASSATSDADASDADASDTAVPDVELAPDTAEPDLRAAQIPSGDPHSLGPYTVGVTTFELPQPGDTPPIGVELWYPALPTDAAATEYTPLDVPLPAGAYRDVPPNPEAAQFLVVFSHGLGGIRQQSYTLCERLASYGFIVVSPDHPGTTTLEFLGSFGSLAAPLLKRPRTIRDAIDRVYSGVVPGLRPRDDGYAFVGHSLGAVTAIFMGGGILDPGLYDTICASDPRPQECNLLGELGLTTQDIAELSPLDPRIKVTVLQNASGAFAAVAGTLANIPKPLLQGGTRDRPDDTVIPLFEQLAPGATFALYEGGGHNAPSDICNIPIAAGFAKECAGPKEGFAEPDVVRDLIVGHAVAWLGVHFGQQPSFEAFLGPGEGYTWQVRASE